MSDHQDEAAVSSEQVITGVLSEHTADYRIAPDGSDRDVVVVCDGRDCEDWVGADSHEHAEHTTAILVGALAAAGKTIAE